VGEGLLQPTVGADSSVVASSVKKHAYSGLMRSKKTEAQGDEGVNDPMIFPTQMFMASLRDGVDSDSLALAVEQVAHLARATSGLIVTHCGSNCGRPACPTAGGEEALHALWHQGQNV